MRTWVDVAILAKSRNLDGRFVARAAAGLPFLLEEGDTVSLVPPKLDVPRTVTVSHVVLLDDDRAEITFDEVDDALNQKLSDIIFKISIYFSSKSSFALMYLILG